MEVIVQTKNTSKNSRIHISYKINFNLVLLELYCLDIILKKYFGDDLSHRGIFWSKQVLKKKNSELFWFNRNRDPFLSPDVICDIIKIDSISSFRTLLIDKRSPGIFDAKRLQMSCSRKPYRPPCIKMLCNIWTEPTKPM